MATMLELTKRLARATGVINPAEITTIEGQSDETILELVQHLIDANLEIERQRDDWFFRIKEGEIETEEGVGRYDVKLVLSDYKKIYPYKHPESARYILVDGKEAGIRFVPFARWAGRYDKLIANSTTGQPNAFTELPNGQLEFYPTPSRAYVINFNYVRQPLTLDIKDVCEPAIPSDLHSVVLYHAIRNYAMQDEATQRIQTVQVQLDQAMMDLRNDQLPETRTKDPGFTRRA